MCSENVHPSRMLENVTRSCIYRLCFFIIHEEQTYYFLFTMEPFPSLILNCETSWFQYELNRLIIDHTSDV